MSFSNDGSSGDEMPSGGHVNVKDVTKGWLLRTDEELAHRLQDEEITKHLSGNRHRNGQIREDFPAAAAAQRRVEDKARRKARLQKRQAEEDAQVARELQALQQLEAQKGRISQHAPLDHLSNFASQLPDDLNRNSNINSNSFNEDFIMATTSTLSDVSNNNETYPSDQLEVNGKLSKMMRNLGLEEMRDLMMASGSGQQMSDQATGFSTKYLEELEAALGVSREQLHQEQTRLLQEERDAELARLLGSKGKEDPVEIRDGELARLLQNREYERFRKLKEKQKLRALEKQRIKENSCDNRNLDMTTDVADLYCQPCDLIPGANRQKEPQPGYLDTYSTLAEFQEDPYYTEPFNTRGSFQDNNMSTSHSDQINRETKSFRPPPAPPRPAGRPKMAEPDVTHHNNSSLAMAMPEEIHFRNPPIQENSNQEDDSKRHSKKGNPRQQDGRQKSGSQKNGCRQQ